MFFHCCIRFSIAVTLQKKCYCSWIIPTFKYIFFSNFYSHDFFHQGFNQRFTFFSRLFFLESYILFPRGEIFIIWRFQKTLTILIYLDFQTQLPHKLRVWFSPQSLNWRFHTSRGRFAAKKHTERRFRFLIVWRRFHNALKVVNLFDF